jgi:proline iminopeptidase
VNAKPMTAEAARSRQHARLARTPGLSTVERPLPDGASFRLSYVRSPNGNSPVVLVFPGGPGLASVAPYFGLRARAAKLGLDLVMVEHRGVGLSRASLDGIDLPREAITIRDVIDDAAAVLDAEGLDRVIVYGTSYGSYLAQGFGARYPERVAGMVLDSAMLGAAFEQESLENLHSVFWHGTPSSHDLARRIRSLVTRKALDPAGVFPLQLLYEFGGPEMVERMLSLLERGKGKRLWRWIDKLGSREIMTPTPFVMEFDLAGEIAFSELNFGSARGEGPLRLNRAFEHAATGFSPFSCEPFDLVEELPRFTWPTVVISGDRDLRTPRSTANRVVELIPGARLLPVSEHGHSALDTHPDLALAVMRSVARGVRDAGQFNPAFLPANPKGSRSVMATVVSLRLALARVVPPRFS